MWMLEVKKRSFSCKANHYKRNVSLLFYSGSSSSRWCVSNPKVLKVVATIICSVLNIIFEKNLLVNDVVLIAKVFKF